MAANPKDGLRFVPTEVEGVSNVTEVAVYPDRIELHTNGEWVVVRLLAVAKWYHRGWLYRPLALLGFGVYGWPAVAGRMWRPPPHPGTFAFYTDPKIVVTVPSIPVGDGHMDTLFQRIKEVMGAGGFSTYDLG